MIAHTDDPTTTAPREVGQHDRERMVAIETLERALDLPPAELTAEVDVAERAIARLRNRLIAELRVAPPDNDNDRLRQTLEAANVAISLVAGVEYPAAGIQRTLLEQARDVLRTVRSAQRRSL